MIALRFLDQLPAGPIREEFQQLVASINKQFGASQAIGSWIDVVHDASAYQIDGAGNSWTVNPRTATTANPFPPRLLSYMMLGDTTMLLNIAVRLSAITVAAAVTSVRIRIPDQYIAVGGGIQASSILGNAGEGREYSSMGWMIDNAVNLSCLLLASGQFIYVFKADLTNLVTATDFTVLGQIALEVRHR